VSDQHAECDKEKIIRQLLKVQAQVTVTPLVKHGMPKVYCINSSLKRNFDCCVRECCDYDCCHCDCCDCCDCCDWDPVYDTAWESGRTKHKCNFTLTQLICVEIPISIDADVDVDEGIVCCGRPDFKSIDDKNENNQFYMQNDIKTLKKACIVY